MKIRILLFVGLQRVPRSHGLDDEGLESRGVEMVLVASSVPLAVNGKWIEIMKSSGMVVVNYFFGGSAYVLKYILLV